MLASSVQSVVACNATPPRVCTLLLFIIVMVSMKCRRYGFDIPRFLPASHRYLGTCPRASLPLGVEGRDTYHSPTARIVDMASLRARQNDSGSDVLVAVTLSHSTYVGLSMVYFNFFQYDVM